MSQYRKRDLGESEVMRAIFRVYVPEKERGAKNPAAWEHIEIYNEMGIWKRGA